MKIYNDSGYYLTGGYQRCHINPAIGAVPDVIIEPGGWLFVCSRPRRLDPIAARLTPFGILITDQKGYDCTIYFDHLSSPEEKACNENRRS